MSVIRSLTAKEARELDVEVEMAVFGSQWFQVRLVESGNPEKVFEWLRLLTPAQVTRYPFSGWSIQPASADECMALYRDKHRNSVRPKTMWDGSRYSTEMEATWDMEEEIQRQGLTAEYGSYLIKLVPRGSITENAFAMAHASPEIRCRAALLTVREANQ